MHDEASLWRSLLALRRPDGAHARPAPARDAPAAQAALIDLYLPLAEARGPYAVAHLGQSLDGRIATAAGASRWVTGEEDLLHTHRMRALADAILVGSGTLRHDDPQLTVRRCAGDQLAAADRARPGERLGQAEIVPVPRGEGGLAPRDIRSTLAARGLDFLFIEGGGVTISRFLVAGALDRLQLTVAPVILGSGRPSLSLPEIVEPHQGLRPRLRRFSLGEDVLYECIFHD